MPATKRTSYRGYYYLVAALVFALDQVTKLAIVRNIPLNRSVALIPGFFGLSHVLNPGAAFSLFGGSAYAPKALIAFSSVVLLAIFVVLWRADRGFALPNLSLALIMGGAMGNLLDRLRIGSVVDFLMFKFGSYYYPDFNVADSAIVVGSLLLIAELFFHREPSRN